MNPCLFQSPAGAASTFEPFRVPALATLYTAPSRSFGVRLVHREWSYGLSWVSPARALPSLTLCLYYITGGRFCQGVSETFFEVSCSGLLSLALPSPDTIIIPQSGEKVNYESLN